MVRRPGQGGVRPRPVLAQCRHDPVAKIIASQAFIAVTGIILPVELFTLRPEGQTLPVQLQQRAPEAHAVPDSQWAHGGQPLDSGPPEQA